MTEILRSRGTHLAALAVNGYRDTLRIRALRTEIGHRGTVISLCDLPGDTDHLTPSCFSIHYTTGMSLAPLAASGFVGPIEQVLIEFGSRMPTNYLSDSLPDLLEIF